MQTNNPGRTTEVQEQIKQACLQCFGAIPETIETLSGGLSGAAVYKVLLNGREYAVKLEAPSNDPARQYAADCAAIAASAGIAPAIHYNDPAAGISISDCITPMPLRSLPPEQMITLLGQTIRRVHNMPLFARQQDMCATIDGLLTQFCNAGQLTGPLYDEGIALYQQLRAAYPWHDTRKVSSHNDLNPNNILFDGSGLWIIDWDAAFANDPYTDLATAANFFATTPQLEELLLQTYFGAGLQDAHRARCFVMQQICRFVYALLMFGTAAEQIPELLPELPQLANFSMEDFGTLMQQGTISLATAKGRLLYGQALFNQALQHMRSERFARALPLLEQTLTTAKLPAL